MLIYSSGYRGYGKQKPRQWGPMSAVVASVLRNAELMGLPGFGSYIPFWERGGTVAHDFGKIPVSWQLNAANMPTWGNDGLICDNSQNNTTAPLSLNTNEHFYEDVITNITVGCRVTFDSDNGGPIGLWGLGGPTNGVSVAYKTSPKTFEVTINAGSLSDQTVTTTTTYIPTGQTIDFVVVLDNQSVYVYINGELVQSGTYTGTIESNSVVPEIGLASQDGVNDEWGGTFKSFWAVREALSSNQVEQFSDSPYFLLQPVAPVYYSIGGDVAGFAITNVNQDHIVGSLDLSQLHNLLPGDVAQTQTIDNVTVAQLQSILVNSVAQVQVIDPLTFSVAGSLSINNILQTNVISNISLSQLQQLVTNNVDQAHTVGGFGLDQLHDLVANSVSQGQVVESLSVVVPGSLTINSILQPQNIDPQLLSHYSTLTTNNVSHGQLLDSLTVEQKHEVLCASIAQGHTIDTTGLEQLISISVDSVAHSQNVDEMSFSTSLVVDGVQQGQTIGSLSVTQIASLIVDTINQGHYVDNLTFSASGRLRITVTTSKSGVTVNADTYGNTIN